MSIHYEDYGYGVTEYWGFKSTHHQWVLEDDYGQPTESDEPLYVEIKVEKNGKTKWYEAFVDEEDIIASLKELVPEWFTKTFNEELGEEIELCQGYTLEEIEEDPLLVCERYATSTPEDDYWDRVDYEYERMRDMED